MPIQIDQVTVPSSQGPPEWLAALAAEIAQIARDTTAQRKAVERLSEKVDALTELVRRRTRA